MAPVVAMFTVCKWNGVWYGHNSHNPSQSRSEAINSFMELSLPQTSIGWFRNFEEVKNLFIGYGCCQIKNCTISAGSALNYCFWQNRIWPRKGHQRSPVMRLWEYYLISHLSNLSRPLEIQKIPKIRNVWNDMNLQCQFFMNSSKPCAFC